MNPLIWVRLLAYADRVGFEQQRARGPRDVRADGGQHSAATRRDAEPDDSRASSPNGDGSGALHLTVARVDAASALMSEEGIASHILAVPTSDPPAHAPALQPATHMDEVPAGVRVPGQRPADGLELAGRGRMGPAEIHTKAVIAAALIGNRAVEIPSVPQEGHWSADGAAVRLRDLTDYIYQVLAAQAPGGN